MSSGTPAADDQVRSERADRRLRRRKSGPWILGSLVLVGFALGAGASTLTKVPHLSSRTCETSGHAPLTLAGCDLRAVDLRDADLRAADLRSAIMDGADLHGLDLSGANLSGASLAGARLHDAYLAGTILKGATIRGADFSHACLRGADLTGLVGLASWTNADLMGALTEGRHKSSAPPPTRTTQSESPSTNIGASPTAIPSITDSSCER
jgi:hypothetical protein